MKTYHTYSRFINKRLWFKCAIFILTVGIIVSFLPNEGKFNYQFDINKPWKYGLLQASFDFPIYKSDEQVQKEQDSIMAGYKPYYKLDKKVEEQMLAKFKSDYDTKYKHFLPYTNFCKYVENLLKAQYEKGIMEGGVIEQLLKDSIQYIQVVNDALSTQTSIKDLHSVKGAYEEIMNTDTAVFNRVLLQKCNLNEYITPNLIYDSEKSEAAKEDLLSGLSWASGLVMNGQKIIDRGEIVDERTFNILTSLQKEWETRNEAASEKRLATLGQLLFVSIIVGCFMIFLGMFRKNYFEDYSSMTLLFALITLFSALSSIMVQQAFTSIYIIPFAMVPIIVSIFLDSRTAFMTHASIVLLSSLPLRSPHEFILIQIIAGMAAIYSLRELSQRSQLLRSAVIVFMAYSLLYFALDLSHVEELKQLNRYMYLFFFINGILLLFIYPLLFILEKMFGFTSNVTLVELSNINNKLLREMSEIAPGTFQHSLQLANLTAAAANKIGANSQLVRTGALYHDIGKMQNPAFFTENQSGVNPHEKLSYKQSAQIVISHITDGLKLADKNNLPRVIRDFINTHHGSGLTKYFYISYQNEHPDEEVDKEDFRYPGPNPFTKEQAILMMADSVEAASRSLPEYTEESISALVEKIIESQVQEGYFKECPITFLDIAKVKAVFKEKLKTMYHTRVSYPELKK